MLRAARCSSRGVVGDGVEGDGHVGRGVGSAGGPAGGGWPGPAGGAGFKQDFGDSLGGCQDVGVSVGS